MPAGLLISELLTNPAGPDSPFEYVELIATQAINFAITPYTVVFANNGPANGNGWVAGAGLTYGFSITTGTVTAGQVVYVGGSSMAPTGTKLRTIDTGTTPGDGFGNLNTIGVLGNGGPNADAVGVFDVAIGSITDTTVPIDAIFFGTGAGTAVVALGADGYVLPVNDNYAGGFLQAASFVAVDPVANNLIATGTYNSGTGTFTTNRTWAPGALTDGTSSLTVTASTQPDLSVTLADSPDPIVVGNTVTYTLVVSNTGTANATGVDTNFTLPTSGFTFGSTTVAGGFTAGAPAGGVIAFTGGSLAAGGTATLTITGTATTAGTLTGGGAAVDPTNTIVESNELNNTAASTTTTVTAAAQPDLSVTLADSPDPITIGNTVTYTLVVSNTGTGNATGITTNFTLPTSGFTFGTTTVAGGFTAGAPAGGVISFTGGSITAGGTATLTITGTATTAGTLTGGGATVDPTNTIVESDETNNTAAATTTTVNAAIVPTKISVIQGTGTAATAGIFTIEGIVVGSFQGTGGLGGFYLQEEDADADANPLTSEGIFVNTTATLVTIGDKVRVTGTVLESGAAPSFNQAVITPTSITALGTGALPTAATVNLPFATSTFLEQYEGMRITFPQALTVTEHFQLARFGEIVLSSGGRLFTPTNLIDPNDNPASGTNSTGTSNVAAVTAAQTANDLNKILIDDGSTVQNVNPVPYIDPVTKTLRIGSTTTGLTGVLGFGFSNYRVQPTVAPTFAYAPRPLTPPSVNLTGTANVKVASFNVLNYFTTIDNGSNNARGADSAAEFTRQRDKIIGAIVQLNADVVGLIEIENNGATAIGDLVAGLNAVAGAGTYAAIVDPTGANGNSGTDAIKVAFIYKPGAVTPVGAAKYFNDPAFNTARPPLAQTFSLTSTGEKFTPIINHFKSKGSSAGLPGDTDQGDGQGQSNATRKLQAAALLNFVTQMQTNSGDSDILILGDLNAYNEEDPIDILRAGGLTKLTTTTDSFVFSGQTGSLDHALSNSTLLSQVTGVAKWNINADEPSALGFDDNIVTPSTGDFPINDTTLYQPNPFRSSDHDPVLVGLNLRPAVVTPPPVTPPPTPGLTRSNNNIFTLVTSTALPSLQLTVSGRDTPSVNELGVLVVDNDQGAIGTFSPGQAGYLQEAFRLGRGNIILSALPDSLGGANLSRTLNFGTTNTNRLLFYFVKNSTTDEVLSGFTPQSQVVFGLAGGNNPRVTNPGSNRFTLNWEDGSDNDFNDLVLNLELSAQPQPLGASSQGRAELVDLRGLTGNVSATFVVNREAAFNNTVGFYRVANTDGGIDINGDGSVDISVGSSGYIQAALQQRLQLDLTVADRSSVSTTVQFAAGSLFAPFIIANGTVSQLLDSNPNNDPAIYFPFLGANRDGVDHIRLLGNNTFGFEDLPGGGDRDYNDMVVQISSITRV